MSARQDSGLVLLVEDDEIDYQLIQIALRKKRVQATVFRVPDAHGAMAYLQGLPPFEDRDKHPLPTRICTDLRLPGINGYELIKWVRQRPEFSEISIVVFSAVLSADLSTWLPGTYLCAGKSNNFNIYAELLHTLLTSEPNGKPRP
jgi:CheY-like chemotaxis protein